MPVIANFLREQKMHQGLQHGILQDAKEGVIDTLEVRFEIVPESNI